MEKAKDEKNLTWGFALSAGKLPFSFPLAEPLRYYGFPSRAIIPCVPKHLAVYLSTGQVICLFFWLGT